MKKIIAALILTLPTMAVAIDLEGFYITPKGGVSKTNDTGITHFRDGGSTNNFDNDDLGTGYAAGLSVGKYITNNVRIELEAMQRGSYEYNVDLLPSGGGEFEANISSKSIFFNGFYDFQSFSLGSTPISPYLGGGVGISKNDMSNITASNNGVPNGNVVDGKTIGQFAYKLTAGTLISMTENFSVDINYQYVNLGSFKSTTTYNNGTLDEPINGGEIKTQELMVGLQYKF